jgi:polar amino acid transport system substrate-binding protein
MKAMKSFCLVLITVLISIVSSIMGIYNIAFADGVTVDDIKKMGKLRIGVEASYVPFVYRTKEGKIIGYDVDLADEFCKTLGVKPEFVDTVWSGIIPALFAKKFEIIMACMNRTPERSKQVLFSIPYAEGSNAMLIRAADAGTIKSWKDLSGKIMGVKLGSLAEAIARDHDKELKATKGQGFSELKIFDDHPASYLALAQGRIDVVYNVVTSLAIVVRDQPGKFAIVKGLGRDSWAGIPARKEDEGIVNFVNSEIRRLKANGMIYRNSEKWFGFRMELPDDWPAK